MSFRETLNHPRRVSAEKRQPRKTALCVSTRTRGERGHSPTGHYGYRVHQWTEPVFYEDGGPRVCGGVEQGHEFFVFCLVVHVFFTQVHSRRSVYRMEPTKGKSRH